MDEHPLVEQFRRECSTAPLGLWATGEIPPWEIEIRPDGTGTVHYGGMEKDEWEIEWRTVAEREIEIGAVSYQTATATLWSRMTRNGPESATIFSFRRELPLLSYSRLVGSHPWEQSITAFGTFWGPSSVFAARFR